MGGKKEKDELVLNPIEVIILAICFVVIMYVVFLPIWGFMGSVVRTLGGR